MTTKSWYQSKLIWVGVVQVLIGALDLIQTNVLNSEVAAWGAVLTGTVTVILRVVTRTAIK